MKRYIKGNIIIAVISVVLLVFIDFFTKKLAFDILRFSNGISVIKGIFRLEYVENKGAAFGILQGRLLPVIIITPILVFLVAFIYIKSINISKFKLFRIVSIFFIAGTIGNFIDRVFYGYVIDFLYFELINFPVFNMADIYLTLSTIVILIALLVYYRDEDWNFIRKNKK